MAARPLVGVVSLDGKAEGQTALPDVFTVPIRTDVVQKVFTDISKNHRQPYAVKFEAGMQSSAESWGTGRAVSRIPRVPGGGTHRAGQGAFGNMCRGGRMFAPTKTWRRWHRKVNINQRRYAVASALAATALPALVMARGHRIDTVPEVPLVLADGVESITKTSAAVEVLKKVGAYADVEKAKNSRNIRRGKGKMRNRRYVGRKGPLVIYAKDDGITKAFRNLPGVELASVDRLNLLQLAPGGHLGRLCIWTKSAFEKLDEIFGTKSKPCAVKKGFVLPRSIMTNSDLTRLINSDELQSVVNPPKEPTGNKKVLKKNPIKNFSALVKINPYAKAAKRMAILAQEKSKENREARLKAKRTERKKAKAVGHQFYNAMIKDADYVGEDYEVFSTWLGTTQ